MGGAATDFDEEAPSVPKDNRLDTFHDIYNYNFALRGLFGARVFVDGLYFGLTRKSLRPLMLACIVVNTVMYFLVVIPLLVVAWPIFRFWRQIMPTWTRLEDFLPRDNYRLINTITFFWQWLASISLVIIWVIFCLIASIYIATALAGVALGPVSKV